MIVKVPGFVNKYQIKDPVTNDEVEQWLKPLMPNFKGFILNRYTAAKIGVKPGQKFVTINNRVENGYLYVNRMC